MKHAQGNGSVAPRRAYRFYPWGKWFSSDRFVLEKGVDYDAKSYIMSQQVRTRVASHMPGVRVSIKISDDDRSIEVKVHRPKTPKVKG